MERQGVPASFLYPFGGVFKGVHRVHTINVWGGYMEVGDVVLSQNMKRYIVAARVDAPSEDYQIVEFGEVVESEWVRLVCIRFGDVLVYPVLFLRFLKPCGYAEFVQAVENLKPRDRVLLDFLRPFFGGYECQKSDSGSVFIK